MIEGGGWVGVGDERTRVQAGEAVVWPPDVLHGGLDRRDADARDRRGVRRSGLALPGMVDAAAPRRAVTRGEGRLVERRVAARRGPEDEIEGEPLCAVAATTRRTSRRWPGSDGRVISVDSASVRGRSLRLKATVTLECLGPWTVDPAGFRWDTSLAGSNSPKTRAIGIWQGWAPLCRGRPHRLGIWPDARLRRTESTHPIGMWPVRRAGGRITVSAGRGPYPSSRPSQAPSPPSTRAVMPHTPRPSTGYAA